MMDFFLHIISRFKQTFLLILIFLSSVNGIDEKKESEEDRFKRRMHEEIIYSSPLPIPMIRVKNFTSMTEKQQQKTIDDILLTMIYLDENNKKEVKK